jgi:hypothetical protein
MLNKFKHIPFLIIVLFVFSTASFTQTEKLEKEITMPAVMKVDTTINKNPSNKNQTSKNELSLKGFIDKNGDGIDDRLTGGKGKGKGKQLRNRDVFIDKNGDGICDGRESAIGLKKTKRLRRGKKR